MELNSATFLQFFQMYGIFSQRCF